jgi:quercetin dioxygenase-like cupin family protein
MRCLLHPPYNLSIKGDIMETKDMVSCMANGTTTYLDREDAAGEIPWNQHPKFKGVYLKHLIKGADTEGKLSCHMVRIDPDAILEEHIHENQWELHEVIAGEGKFVLDEKETPYNPGRMGMIPQGIMHKVVAGKSGLVLLAKFFPALI